MLSLSMISSSKSFASWLGISANFLSVCCAFQQYSPVTVGERKGSDQLVAEDMLLSGRNKLRC